MVSLGDAGGWVPIRRVGWLSEFVLAPKSHEIRDGGR